MNLSPELLSTISHHLRPRHLYRLMQTSKQLKSIADSEEYWSRAAVHAVFRHFPATEMMECYDGPRVYPKLTGLYNLLNLDLGYYETLNHIIGRVRHMVTTGSSPPGSDWKELTDASLPALVRAGEAAVRVDPFRYQDAYLAYLEDAATMKDVVKREALREIKLKSPR
jgi:F-box domain